MNAKDSDAKENRTRAIKRAMGVFCLSIPFMFLAVIVYCNEGLGVLVEIILSTALVCALVFLGFHLINNNQPMNKT